MVHKERSWTDAFLEYILLQIQKLRNNAFYGNKFSVNHDFSQVSSWLVSFTQQFIDWLDDQSPSKLDTNNSDKTHHDMLNTIIKVMFRQLNSIEELADDDDDDAKSDLFEDPTQANLIYPKGKSVRRGGEFHIEVPSEEEVYSMSDAILPVPTPQAYTWQNTDGGGVVSYNNFSSSSGPHLPLEKELSGGIVRGRLGLFAANSSNHYAPESSTRPHETNFPFPSLFWDDRNPPLFEDSLEPEDAAGDRDDVVSDSTFRTEHGTSMSSLFSDRGTDLLAEKGHLLAHSRSAGGNHRQTVASSSKLLEASESRKIKREPFRCTLCPSTFTAKHNLMSKSPLQIFVALSLMSVFQIISILTLVTKKHQAMILEILSLLKVLLIGIARGVKVPKPKHCRNPPNSQINLKTIGPLKSKDSCRGQHRVATTRPDGMFSASCKTASSILPFKTVIYFALSSYICHVGFFRPFQCPSPVGMIFESLFSSC